MVVNPGRSANYPFSSSRSDYGDQFPSLSEALSAVGGPKTKHGARSKSSQSKSKK